MTDSAPRRVGRPKRGLVEPTSPLTGRVRHLIDVAHDGNLSEAASLTGISYPTLRELYSGTATAPNLRTMDQLRAPYGVDVGWLAGEGGLGSIPVVGRIGLIPPHPMDAAKSRALREVLIPYRAWPMYQLIADLERELLAVGASATRSIVGEASGDAFQFRLTTFLLQPLLAVEKLGVEQVILAAPAGTAEHAQTDEVLLWTDRLCKLGRLWRALTPMGLQPNG